MLPQLFSLFGYPVHTYGVTAAMGFLAGFFFARWQAVVTKQDPEHTADLIFYAIIFGVIGARILYVMLEWNSYFAEHPSDILRIDKGGLVFYGGPLFTALPLWWVMRRRGLSIWAYSDLVMPATILGLGFGRLGCLAAGCCYGHPAEVSWAIHYPEGSTPAYAYLGAALHPTPLYEFAACIAITVLAAWYNRRKKHHGETFFLTVLSYAIARSIIEVFRGDKVRGFLIEDVLSTSQAISIFVGIACIGAWLYFRKKPTKTMSLDYYPKGEGPYGMRTEAPDA